MFGRLALRARERSEPPIPLHVGDTWLEPFEAGRIDAITKAERLHTYAPVQGEPVLLDAIQRHLARRSGTTIDRELLQVMSGATSGLSVIVDAIVDPGDDVMILAPYWPLIRGIVQRRGARPVEVPYLDRPRSAEALTAELERALTPETAALYVNSPHNPTGSILTNEELEAIARFAARHDLWVFADEVYEELTFDEPPPPIWARPDLRERTIAIHSTSKAYGLAGCRVGFAHGPPEAMQAIRGVQTYVTYCAPKAMQHLAAKVLDEGLDWLRATRGLYEQSARRAADALGVPRPPGGTFLFLDVRPHLRDGEDTFGFLERCLERGVLLTPGASSGRDYEGFVRLCFTAVPPETLGVALERIAPLFGRG